MGQINIDKYFKKRLSSYSEEIDTDAIWNNLDLPEKKKNRGIIIWLFRSVAVLTLLAIVYFGFFVSDNGTTELTQKPTNADHYTNNYKEENIKTTAPTAHITDTNDKIITEKDNWKEKSKSSISNEIPLSTQQGFSKPLESNKYSEPRKTKVGSNTIIQTPIESIQNNPISNQNTRLFKESDQKVSRLAVDHLASIDMLDNELLDYASQMGDFENRADKMIIEPLTSKNTQSIDIDVYSSYNFAERRLTTEFPDRLGEFIQSKNDSETILDAISIGTSIRYNLRSGLYAKLGVEALRITERFDHTEESTETIIIEDLIRGTIPVTSRWINYNHHNLLSIPISMGYEQNRGRWTYYAEGSFHLNLLYQFSGLQLDAERNVAEKVVIEEEEISDNRPKHSYVLSAGVRYQLAPRMSLYLQPRFQSTFSTNSSSSPDGFSTPISQNYNLYGIQFGLSYSLH